MVFCDPPRVLHSVLDCSIIQSRIKFDEEIACIHACFFNQAQSVKPSACYNTHWQGNHYSTHAQYLMCPHVHGRSFILHVLMCAYYRVNIILSTYSLISAYVFAASNIHY